MPIDEPDFRHHLSNIKHLIDQGRETDAAQALREYGRTYAAYALATVEAAKAPTTGQSVELSVADIEAAIKNAQPERIIVRQELRQRTGEAIEVLHERIELRVTALQQALAVFATIRPYLRQPERESHSHSPLEFRMDDEGEVDEVVGTCDVHLERLAGNSWWLGVYRPGTDDRAAITLHTERATIKATINEELPTEEQGREP